MGTAISAAPVGVGARRSEAKSISVVSVSWPMAEMSGMALLAVARTTISSLKPHKSSSEPPPRATMMRSGLGMLAGFWLVSSLRALKPSIAALTSAAQVSPCTRAGQMMTWQGKRSLMRCIMSLITAPVGEVMTPITLGKNGNGCLRSVSNRPSAASFFLRASSMAINAPTPAGSKRSMMI